MGRCLGVKFNAPNVQCARCQSAASFSAVMKASVVPRLVAKAMMVIPATTKAHHVEDNMGAAFGRYPDEAMRKRIVEWFTAL